jgi:galactonate dehydratase
MKIWPFDPAAERSGGREIGAAALHEALEPLRKVRAAVGDEIDVLVELHALWDPAPARRILDALEPLQPRWVEDPIRLDAPEQAAALQARTSLPIAGGETLAGVAAFKALLDRGALSVAIVDLGWCGGLTTARRVAALAEAAGVSVAAHDCTGPVGLAAATHFTIATPNAFVQEIVRAFYHGWYGDLVTALPPLARGEIRPLEGPGLGLALRPEARERGRRRATGAQTSTTTGSTIGRRRSRA